MTVENSNSDLTVGAFTGNMPTMFARLLKKPTGSFFLLGPRATGKSTWIEKNFPDATTYDLLNSKDFLRFTRDPSVFFQETELLPESSWVVIDEIQKVPALLNEVHRLIERRKLRFVLSGSSARKLRHGGSNLLAGRAVIKQFFPLTSAEMNFDFDPESIFQYGSLPLLITGDDPEEYLSAYADGYLREEIQAEALTRNIGGFSRFLEIAARQNAQLTNLSGISRDAAVPRQTVSNYFEILNDTLLGHWLTPWKLKRATKQVTHSKFYLFDCGIARALSGRLPYPPTQEEKGALLETFILNEVRAFFAYNNIRYPLHFWRNYDGTEVDLLCETKNGFTAIEIKVATSWERRYSRGLIRIQNELSPAKTSLHGVYCGSRPAQFGSVHLHPVMDFLKKLWAGEIFD